MNKLGNLHPKRRRGTAALGAALIAIGISLIPIQQAAAETAISADRTAWFWSSNQDFVTSGGGASAGASGTGGVFGNGSGVASPVSPGHMAVGMKNGNSDMRSYVHFDTSAIPVGSEISSFIVAFSVSQPSQAHTAEHSKFGTSGRGHPPATTNAGQAAILACLVSEPFGDNMSGGGGGDPPYSSEIVNPADSDDKQAHVTTNKNEPSSDCGVNATGKPSSDGSTWTFDITRIAQTWASGARFNEGIALLPQNISVSPTWTIEFHGPALALKEKTGGSIQYVTAKEAPKGNVEFTAGSTAGGPIPIDNGGVGNCCPAPPPITVGPIDTGLPPADPLTPTPVTSVLGEQLHRGGGGVPVGFVGSTPAWLFLVILLILGGVYLLQMSIGTDLLVERGGVVGVRNRVARVLQGRRLAGAESLEAAEAIKAEEIAHQESP